MNDYVWTVLLGAPSDILFFSYMLICQCVVKPSINELLAALFILTPSLQPHWVLSPPRQGAAEVGTPRHPSARRRQMLGENEDKIKWFCPSLLSSSERSASPSCFSSWRGRPRHIAIARLNRIHCLTALQVCLQHTLRETGHKTVMKTSQHSASRETVSFCHGYQRWTKKAIQNYPVHSYFTFTWYLEAWKKNFCVFTVDFVAMCLL